MRAKDDLKLDHKKLTQWYKKNRRQLPWRESKDPYRIWLSEVMLQQTTVVAVIPYFERFLQKFPTLADLASAPEARVLEAWAGLGYYSRARNLHKAAKALIDRGGFPETADELIALPGFGPYTSRAVASIAFGEKVGVLDGNVIRVLSRKYGLALDWWLPKGRQPLQELSDQMAQLGQPDLVSQGLMELGATVCTPQRVQCFMCPWADNCVARQQNKVEELPSKKPRRKSEVWVWQPEVHLNKGQVGLIKNDYAPFLKGQMIFPGTISQEKSKPKDYDVKHNITHHDIFIRIKTSAKKNPHLEWVKLEDLSQVNPSSLLKKVLSKME